MKEISLLIAFLIFLISAACIFFVVKRNIKRKIIGKDINKKGEPIAAEGPGIILLIPLWISLLFAGYYFSFKPELIVVGIAITVFTIIGFFDDNKKKFVSKFPIGWKVRAIPIAVTSLILAGIFFASTNILLSIFLIILFALFFAGVASFSNTFEGLNGWTTGSSFIISIALAIVSLKISYELSFLYLCLSATILGLFVFNKYPAKTFPGDSGTLLIGASIAGLALFSQNIYFVIFTFLLFIPHMIDFFGLKMVTNRHDASQYKMRPYKLLSNGKLTIPDYKGKTKYDFAKLVMKIFGPLYEWQIVIIIWIIVIINSVLWSSLFWALL